MMMGRERRMRIQRREEEELSKKKAAKGKKKVKLKLKRNRMVGGERNTENDDKIESYGLGAEGESKTNDELIIDGVSNCNFHRNVQQQTRPGQD